MQYTAACAVANLIDDATAETLHSLHAVASFVRLLAASATLDACGEDGFCSRSIAVCCAALHALANVPVCRDAMFGDDTVVEPLLDGLYVAFAHSVAECRTHAVSLLMMLTGTRANQGNLRFAWLRVPFVLSRFFFACMRMFVNGVYAVVCCVCVHDSWHL